MSKERAALPRSHEDCFCTAWVLAHNLCTPLINKADSASNIPSSTMANTNPLELPEIRTSIGQYLSRSDLVRCLRVCKSWHASFLPLVWSSVDIRATEYSPTVESLRRYRHLVKHLQYHTEVWKDYDSIHCHHLSSLQIYCKTASSTVVIPQYDQLRELVIRGNPSHSYSQHAIWKPTHTMKNLQSLRLDHIEVDLTATDVFWDLCTQLHSLDILVSGVARLPDKGMNFERIQKLGLLLRPEHSFEEQLDWITRCPNLTELNWCDHSGRVSLMLSDTFADHVANGAWPELSELRLTYRSHSETPLIRVIQGMRQVKLLEIQGFQFGPLTFTALRPHFHVLRQLNIGFRPTVMGSAFPEILASCPLLEDLTMRQVQSQDIIQGLPWACEHSMRTLRLNVIVSSGQDSDHHQQLVLERLSRLVNLETLNLNHFHHDGEATHLGLRLGKGLEQLCTLKKLRDLAFSNYSQKLSTMETQWMIENWRNLRRVSGSMTQAIDSQVVPMFEAAGIIAIIRVFRPRICQTHRRTTMRPAIMSPTS